MLTAIGGLPQHESAYGTVNWEAGERPEWWLNTTLLWEFHLKTEARFATSNLEEAVLRISQEVRRPLQEVRQEVFLHIPLTVPQQVTFGPDSITATCHERRPFLRAQVKRLRQLEESLTAYREGVIKDVLLDFTTAVETSSVDALFDGANHGAYLGVTPTTLRAWAEEYNAYEVADFMKTYRKVEQQKVPVASAPDEDKEHERLVAQHGEAIMRMGHYFDRPDFEPLDEHEARALELHKLMRAALTAVEEERLLKERDRHLIHFVFQKA